MAIFLTILKIIGIVLLSVLGIALLLLLLLLVWPFQYRISGQKKEQWNGFVGVSWLFHIISVKALYTDAFNLVVRVFGIPVYNYQKKKKRYDTEEKEEADFEPLDTLYADGSAGDDNSENPEDLADRAMDEEKINTAPDEAYPGITEDKPEHENANHGSAEDDAERENAGKEPDSENKNPKGTEDEPDRENAGNQPDTESETPKGTEDEPDRENAGKEPDSENKNPEADHVKDKERKSGRLRKFKQILRKIIRFLENLPMKLEQFSDSVIEKIEKALDTYEYYDKLLMQKGTEYVIQFLKTKIVKILKHLKPFYCKIVVDYVSEDPATIGKLMEYYAMALPYLPKKFEFHPAYREEEEAEEKPPAFQMEAKIKGRFFLGFLAINALQVLLNKRVKIFYKRWKREGV